MSVGNLFDLGPKPYENLNVNDITCKDIDSRFITCDELNTGTIIISTFDANIIETETLRVNTIVPKTGTTFIIDGGVVLDDILLEGNNQTEVLVRDTLSGRIESRFFPLSETISAFALNDNLLTTNLTTFQEILLLQFTPVVSGYYKYNFKVALGTTAANRGAFALFVFPFSPDPNTPYVQRQNEFGKGEDIVSEQWTSITDTGYTYLNQNITYDFYIYYRAEVSSIARAQRAVIIVEFIK